MSREIFGFLGTLPHELGIASLGHRRKLLDAIVALRSETSSAEIEYRSPGAQCSPPEDRAERRQVTVIFSDLVGSTALSTRKDPEDLREVISTFGEPVPALRLY
jgi:class 3 adenylate cyclase